MAKSKKPRDTGSKPEWLKKKEDDQKFKAKVYSWCKDCRHYGPVVDHTKYKGQVIVPVHECGIHPGCLNTEFSAGCPDHAE